MVGGAAALYLIIVLSIVVIAGAYVFFVGGDIDKHRPFHDEEDRR